MEIKLDAIVHPELKEFLLTQEGIIDVDINYDEDLIRINVEYNEKINPTIIMKYIELFENYKFSYLVEFNKNYQERLTTLKYTIVDMCCEFCYMDLIMELFLNKKINAVKSNFDNNNLAFNVEFIIEYCEDYNEEELIRYINEKHQ